MTKNKSDRVFLHKLYVEYYQNEHKITHKKEKGMCVLCGKLRVIGKRGKAKNKCKKCRKYLTSIENDAKV